MEREVFDAMLELEIGVIWLAGRRRQHYMYTVDPNLLQLTSSGIQ